MSVQVKGSGTIGGLDEGLVVSGIVTSSTQINVGSNIKIGNAGVLTATTFSGSGASLTNIPDSALSTVTASKLTGALPAISGANLTGITQTTINNNSGNKVITGSSTANTLEAQDTLRYDGTNFLIGTNTEAPYNNRNLTVAAGASGNSTVAIEIRSPSNGTGRVIFSDGTSADSSANEGQIIYQQSDHKLLFGVAANYQNMALESTGGTGANLNLIDGNLVVANGHGIDFSATANAQPGQYNSISPTTDSEVLHDYEYGSFTPHIRTQGGTSNATYAQKGGYYTKIGRMVYCTFFMNWSNGSNHSGYIYFVGLPYFSGSNTSSHLMYGIGTVQLNGFTISGNRNPLLHMGEQTSGTNLASNNSGGNSINEGHTSNGYIIANITYIANY